VRESARRRPIYRDLFATHASKARNPPREISHRRPSNPRGKPISGPLKPTLPLTKHALNYGQRGSKQKARAIREGKDPSPNALCYRIFTALLSRLYVVRP
jgi:hypothetical protein